ncbi:hypothetical protein LCGC14_1369010 [marine sediment metagenome]|uniref:Uncharacterized protein n=1 Tax=marine sediment metagenome TaxID=412755 RepID=A0A0F9ML42_9ZZZZ
MLGLVSHYNSTEHTIIRCELSHWLERLIEGDPQREGRLFLMRYNELGVFCICEWLGKPNDVFVDVLNLGKSLGNFGQKEALELKRRLFGSPSAEETTQAIIDNDSDYYHNLQDEDMEETERQERVAIGE